jgi:hypothetical protein
MTSKDLAAAVAEKTNVELKTVQKVLKELKAFEAAAARLEKPAAADMSFAQQSKPVLVLASHGITTTDGELSALFEDVLAHLPGSADASLPDDEAALYDSVGFSAEAAAFPAHATSAAVRYAALLTSSDTVEQVASKLRVTRPRVQQMIAAHDLWALRDVRRRWVLPRLQFDSGRIVPGWPVVARAIPANTHPLEVLGLLETPQPELELDGESSTIRNWLLSGGDPATAAGIAAGLGAIGV